jgi:ATP-dependent Lhr-like helicase
MAVNDYGFELLCASEVDWPALLPRLLQSQAALLQEVLASLNASELAQRRFREIARVSGLIFQGYPGEKRSNKQLQASSSLFYEVFRKYDPANRLLLQSEQELLAQELEIGRLRSSLERMETQQLVLKLLAQPTPFSFPLMVERLREQLSSESVADRIARMVQQLEKAAGQPSGGPGAGEDADQATQKVRAALAFGQDTLAASTATKRDRQRVRSKRT